ncbi:MAG: HAD family phosphatase [Planctomycetia bacterium]|nr:HAD family phosphatase [Planctomycetia bacterium]
MRPEFVFLDLGNVIVSFDRERAIRQMAEACGGDAAVIRGLVQESDLSQALERGTIDWPEFHREFSRRTQTRSDPDALAHAASDMFALKIDMLPVIAGLERAGIRMGILSNTSDIHWRHILAKRHSVLPGNFAVTVLSYEVGFLKPEAGIYELSARLAGTAPGRIFFCDDIPAHVEAARAAGWDAEVFTSAAMLTDAFDRRGVNLGL